MNNSNSSSNAKAPRAILTLKPGSRRSLREIKAPSVPRPNSNSKLQSGHSSDEHLERMQAEMDALRR